MPATTLAQAKLNTQDDIDLMVIDEFVKSDYILANVPFDQAVNPAGGGATLTYGYTRLLTERGAEYRAYNAEGASANAVRERKSVELKPISAKYTLDRVLAKLGPAASDEVALQTQQAVKAVRARFHDGMINGTVAGVEGFDGLKAALTGSSTELGAGAFGADFTNIATQDAAFTALEKLDELLGLVVGGASAIVANKKAITKIRALARRAGYYERTKNDAGQVIESYAGIPFVDLGAKSGAVTEIIPVASVDPDAGGALVAANATDIYAVRWALDGFHCVATPGELVNTYLPDFSTAGAVKDGEVELSPHAAVLKATKAAAVLRNVKV